MPVKALRSDYHGDFKDSRDKFHGNIVVYIDWDLHRWFPSPKAFPLPPDMPFGALVEAVLPEAFGQHDQFKDIEWDKVEWSLHQKPFKPDFSKGLEEQGFDHKCVLRFRTPDLVEAL